jgi:hypothetical protein
VNPAIRVVSEFLRSGVVVCGRLEAAVCLCLLVMCVRVYDDLVCSSMHGRIKTLAELRCKVSF